MAHGAVVHDGKVWIMGGYTNSGFKGDVWYSSNGIQWTEATSSAWPARAGLAAVAFDEKIWVMGGQDVNYNTYNDVWYSTDGVNWTQATASAPWNTRSSLSCVVYNNEMWITGGRNSSTVFNDVWHSSDGVNWTQQTASAAWDSRSSHTSLVYNGFLWIMGGSDASNSKCNDVWRLAGVAISEESSNTVQPSSLSAYPNPSASAVTISCSLPHDGNVRMIVYDIMGREVFTITDQFSASGDHSVLWDGRNTAGQRVESGVYFCRCEFDGAAQVKQLILI